jgi:hypothetical protein
MAAVLVDGLIQQRQVRWFGLQAEPLQPGPVLQPVAVAQQVIRVLLS